LQPSAGVYIAGQRNILSKYQVCAAIVQSTTGKSAMMSRVLASILVPTFGSLILAGAAYSQAGGPTPSPPGAAVYFIGLNDGDTLPTKPTIHFGLRGMGVAPAGSDRANSGHHHLVVDAPTPPLNAEIPNDFQHLHFGAGQTEAEVSLTPGEHTLQLVFGDRNHVPHSPPVVSPRIKVKVVEQASPPAQAQGATPSKRHPSPKDAKVYFIQPTDGSYVTPNPVIRFGLLGMGVAPAGFEKANTGHHHLLVDSELPPFDQPIPNDFNHLHFGAGQTEAKISLPLGQHKLRLLFADEAHVPHDPPVYSNEITVIVNATGRRPPPPRPRPFRGRHYRA
jgi:hypothetical protein